MGSDDRTSLGENEAGEVDFDELGLKAGKVFVPSAPVDQKQLFAGRIKQLQALIDAINAQGQHAIVYGERGVGKTSLVSIFQVLSGRSTAAAVAVRENCHSDDTFGRLWKRALEGVKFQVEKKGIGFTGDTKKRITSLGESVADDMTSHDVVSMLRRLDAAIVFIFDEFDQIKTTKVPQAFAETIKALSDHSVPSKIILVGIGDSIDQLIAAHASIERAVVQIRMPRMEHAELAAIIETGSKALGMEWETQASSRVVKLSQGLPHYVHRLALFATRDALTEASLTVTMDNVKVGMKEAVDSASQSLTDIYLKATSSQRKDSLFQPVLLACALSKSDELGYFRPAWIRKPLKEMGHDVDVPAFASHLNKFASDERGNILQKTGADRQWRYRFANPLVQPYVIMRGIAEDKVDVATVDKVLADED